MKLSKSIYSRAQCYKMAKMMKAPKKKFIFSVGLDWFENILLPRVYRKKIGLWIPSDDLRMTTDSYNISTVFPSMNLLISR